MISTVIYGAPGTGKTRELVRRVALTTKRVNPTSIGIVSFTKAAATEIASRVNPALSKNASTLHSLAYRLANISSERVLDQEWANKFTSTSGIELSLRKDEDMQSLPEGAFYLSLYNYARATLNEDYRQVYMKSPDLGALDKFLYFVESYESFKGEFGVIDFNDMLDAAIGCNPNYSVLFLDEAQDFTPQQWQLVQSWVPFVSEITLAGDDDQAIYKWGGADPRGMPNFATEYESEQVVLSQSYRVPAVVHQLATKLISGVKDRVVKKYLPRDDVGLIQKCGDARLVDFSHGDDTLILVRNHSLREGVEDQLITNGIPYIAEGAWPGALQDYQAKAVGLWLKAERAFKDENAEPLNSRNISAIARVAKQMYRSQVDKNIDALLGEGVTWQRALAIKARNQRYLELVLAQFGSLSVPPTIRICTIHGSKGREADHVVLLNGRTQRTAESLDFESELRTFYVGVTRTKRKLTIVQSDNALLELL